MKRLLVLLALAAAPLGGCGGSSASGPTTADAPVFIGVTSGALFAPGVNLDSELRTMAGSGVRSLRAPFYWRRFQPRKGMDLEFSASDRLVGAAARAGIEILPTLLGAPPWAAAHPARSNSPPRGTASFAAFARALVERYGSSGSFWSRHGDIPRRPIRFWQVWNEPNHTFYWSDQPFETAYVRLLRDTRSAIRAADPAARVVLAGFPERSWELIAALYRAGARGTFDVAAVHPYTFEVRNVLGIVGLVRAAMARAGDGARPLMVTEFGWSSGKGRVRRTFGFETTAADQAARLREALRQFTARRRALRIERIYWESWLTRDRDALNPFDFAGLRELGVHGAVASKPAFVAFRDTVRAIDRCLRAHPDATCG